MFNQLPRCVEPPFLAPPNDLGGSDGPALFRLEFNPLNLQINDLVEFHDPDLRGLKTHVYQIASSKVEFDGENYLMADYDLGAPAQTGLPELVDSDGRIRLRLRCLPDNEGGIEAIIFQAQRLDPNSSHLFNQLQHDTNKSTLRDSQGGFQHGFTRIDGATDTYQAIRTCLGHPTNEIDPASTVSRHNIRYLDYERTSTDSAGNSYQQYGLVEYNSKTDTMVTLFGWSIDAAAIKT